MSTKYIASNWRLPNQENSSKSDNYGLTFDGSNEKINCGDSNVLSFGDGSNDSPFSISLWFNLSTLATPSCLLCKQTSSSNGEYKIYISTAGKIYIELANNGGEANGARGIISNSTISINQWYNIIFTYDGTGGSSAYDGMNLYINNSLDSSTDWSYLSYTAMNNTTADFIIGDLITGSSNTYDFTGEMSEVAVFDYALSSTQVSTLYGSSSLGSASPLALKPQPVAYYPLGDNSASNPLTQPNEAVEDASVFDFNGGTDSINIPDSSVLKPSTISVSIWFKGGNQPSNFSYLLAKRYSTGGPAYGFYTGASLDKLSFLIRKGDDSGWAETNINDSGVVMDNNWHNAVGIFDGTNVKLYIDGVLKSTNTTGVSGITYGSGHLTIGALLNTGSLDFNGELSNIAIWNSDQSSEISNIYNSGVPATSYTNTPTAWYKLDQSANWQADSSGAWQIPDAVSAYPQSFDFVPNDIITTNIDLASATSCSVSAWVKFDNVSESYQYIFSAGAAGSAGDAISIAKWTGTGEIYTWDGTTSHRTGTNVTSNSWNNIVVTHTGTERKVYLNGSLIGTFTSGNLNLNSINVIGSFFNSNYWINGKISNVQIWDSSLPATGTDSVETLYNNGVPLTTAIASDNLKLWAKLDNNEKFDGTNWSVENQKYPANWDSALSFDGSNDAVLITDSTTVNSSLQSIGNENSYSISAWVNTTSTINTGFTTWYTDFTFTELRTQTSSGTHCPFYLGMDNGKIFFGRTPNHTSSDERFLSTGTINDGNWKHIVVTINVNALSMYINGSLDSSHTFTTATGDCSVGTTTSNFQIGARTTNAGGLSAFADGLINNISIYTTELDSSAVTALYNNGTPETSISSSPVSWWKLNNLTTGIQDSVGSNDGTNNGATKVNTFVSTEAATSSGMTEQNLVNNNVSALNGESSGMTSANLVLSDLTRAVPYGDGYSFNFDGTESIDCGNPTEFQFTSDFSISGWFKTSSTANQRIVSKDDGTNRSYLLQLNGNSYLRGAVFTSGTQQPNNAGSGLADGNWHHFVFTFQNGVGTKIYIDNGTPNLDSFTGALDNDPADLIIGSRGDGANKFNGQISNISLFNETLTSLEVQKLYSNGVPQDLSSFSPAPVAWYTLGSNSFWNGSNWICRDLIGSNDGTSANAGADAIVGDSPRSTANGVGTNNSIPENLVGTTKWSDNNSWSINMSSEARVQDTP